jgi:hypothetical protein
MKPYTELPLGAQSANKGGSPWEPFAKPSL